MSKGLSCQHPSARGALHQALLDQIRFDDLLNRIARFAECRGKRLKANRTATKSFGNQGEIAAIKSIKAFVIDFEPGQCRICNHLIDFDSARYGGKIAYTLQQATGDARSAARAHR